MPQNHLSAVVQGWREKKSHKVVPKHAGKVAGVGNVGAGKCNQ